MVAPLDPEDLHEREVLKIKLNAAIAAAPVAFTVGWGVLHLIGYAKAPEDWLIGLVAPIVSTAITNLATSYLVFRQRQKRQAQPEKF